MEATIILPDFALEPIIEAVHLQTALSLSGDLSPLPEPHASVHRLLRGPILADYIAGNSERLRFEAPLRLWLHTGNATMAAQQNTNREPGNAYVRAVQRQVSGFCAYAAGQLPKVQAQHRRLFELEAQAKTRQSFNRSELKDVLDAYCDMTCRSAGGTGKTVDPDLAAVRARDCLGCSIRAAVFGPLGWGG